LAGKEENKHRDACRVLGGQREEKVWGSTRCARWLHRTNAQETGEQRNRKKKGKRHPLEILERGKEQATAQEGHPSTCGGKG